MLIMLPPSETKTPRRRGAPVRPDRLSFPELSGPRAEVAQALAAVSALPDATERLGVSPGLAAAVERNRHLAEAVATPAERFYTGVLFDALDLASLDPAALRRARRRIVVLSGLYGAVRLGDALAPYRLAMGVNLDGVGPLAGYWRAHLGAALDPLVGRGLVVDCRSSDYLAAWRPDVAARWVQVKVPGATHMAKHTRGLVARLLCQEPADPRTPAELAELLAPHVDVTLQTPDAGARAGTPSVLLVRPPAG
ncbi:peroxide stress protein YaaA [Arsenicicoccus piscis]|nr:peroxide stress protein YaaA [Arsenicicoccus piscis]